MNMEIFRGRRSVPEYLVGAILFVLDLIAEGFIALVLGSGILWTKFRKWFREWRREDPHNLHALIAAPFIIYFVWGGARGLGYLVKGPTIAIWPAVDWWWMGALKLLNWVVN